MGSERGGGQLESPGDSQGPEAKYIKQEVITTEEHSSKSDWQRRVQELGLEQERAYIQRREHEQGGLHEHTTQSREEEGRPLEQVLQQERSYAQQGVNQQHHFSAFYTEWFLMQGHFYQEHRMSF